MAALNQIEITHSIQISDATKEFLYKNCPENGEISRDKIYYINDLVMEDLKEIAKERKLKLPDLAKIEAFVNKVGLYEFIVGD